MDSPNLDTGEGRGSSQQHGGLCPGNSSLFCPLEPVAKPLPLQEYPPESVGVNPSVRGTGRSLLWGWQGCAGAVHLTRSISFFSWLSGDSQHHSWVGASSVLGSELTPCQGRGAGSCCVPNGIAALGQGCHRGLKGPSCPTGHSRSIPSSFLNHGPYDSYGYGSFGECHTLSPSLSPAHGLCLASACPLSLSLQETAPPAAPRASQTAWAQQKSPTVTWVSCVAAARWHPGSVPSISGKGPGAAGPSMQPPAGFPSVTHLRELCFSNSGFPLKGRSSSSGARPPARRGH